ncbi:MAG: hypothetical protein ACRDF0_05095 [Candidatus Limnocylindria bacterium]
MSRYLLDLIAADIARPSWKEWIREVEKRPTVMTTMTAAEAIREERRAEGSDE